MCASFNMHLLETSLDSGAVAQRSEQSAHNRSAVGSNPTRPTKFDSDFNAYYFIWILKMRYKI